mmetsp:Transcript_26278/g.54101  ORF Transcript_26278/g.54101 Transcript_26278/m.54101 type:complete len:244 (+) Transcript_26278:280-1011(+)
MERKGGEGVEDEDNLPKQGNEEDRARAPDYRRPRPGRRGSGGRCGPGISHEPYEFCDPGLDLWLRHAAAARHQGCGRGRVLLAGVLRCRMPAGFLRGCHRDATGPADRLRARVGPALPAFSGGPVLRGARKCVPPPKPFEESGLQALLDYHQAARSCRQVLGRGRGGGRRGGLRDAAKYAHARGGGGEQGGSSGRRRAHAAAVKHGRSMAHWGDMHWRRWSRAAGAERRPFPVVMRRPCAFAI